MSSFKRVLSYMKPYNFQIALAILCAFMSNIGIIVATYLNGVAVDNIGGINNVNFKNYERG